MALDDELSATSSKKKIKDSFAVLPMRWEVERTFAWLGNDSRKHGSHCDVAYYYGKVCMSFNQTASKLHWRCNLIRGLRHSALVLLFLISLPSHALSFDLFGYDGSSVPDIVILEVVEPFIEMHTGPGRGYPVFNVVEQGENIEILKRKPNWYKIRSPDNKVGWTKAAQLAHTLKPTGVPVDLPEVDHGDYLQSHWRVGFTAGQLEGASTFSVTAGYRPFSWAGAELEAGKIYDESVTSDYYGINLLVEPIQNWVVTPFITIGIGQFSFNNRQKVIVNDTGSSNYTSYGLGASSYIGRNFVIRAEYRWYSVSTDEDSVGLNAWKIGLNTFF